MNENWASAYPAAVGLFRPQLHRVLYVFVVICPSFLTVEDARLKLRIKTKKFRRTKALSVNFKSIFKLMLGESSTLKLLTKVL